MMNRRDVMLAIGASLVLADRVDAGTHMRNPTARLRAIERASGGRLGAFVFDTGSGRSFGWRADEPFCHCSTFKLSLAAMALREADAGRLDPMETLPFSRADIVAYSPVVEENLDKGTLPILALAEAVQVTSDNAAANVLMRRLGGPDAVTQFWRDIGDAVSRLDGYEPAINVIPPGTQENSTTPRAMAETVRRIVLGDVLRPASCDRLRGWMAATQSGSKRIRAGLPAGWHGLDKTGTGMRPGVGNKTNDLAVLMPPGGRSPLIVTGYFENPNFSEDVRPADETTLKTLGRVAVTWDG
ncbi:MULTISPECIES: class A beta-lactamase [unclassified Sphingomonas]|uniref:class A beta-lactamase n=1 Tax=unclassified Sphingomonas TaxID=196159 RepID=UPI0028660B8B|nr:MULTISPECIES: class A beta-lactamase [unclassified Sphingomonas]MDR6116272.1 beta-lactamase class A [Sphingomonas sp. SORGH_AS_0789]MDR6150053.1 beta-lactamase class A [Sphingomonas sp. SORGH_AS_0742]